jgi:Arc/MetJ family transcription regulator
MHMSTNTTRTTLNLDEQLLSQAREYTGIQEKTALIHEALRSLIAREASERLIALGGTMPGVRAGRRRRSGTAG